MTPRPNNAKAHLAEHAHQPLRGVVKLGAVEDHLQCAQDLGEESGDGLHGACAERLTRRLDRLQVLEVVDGLLGTLLDQGSQFVEGLQVIPVMKGEDCKMQLRIAEAMCLGGLTRT